MSVIVRVVTDTYNIYNIYIYMVFTTARFLEVAIESWLK